MLILWVPFGVDFQSVTATLRERLKKSVTKKRELACVVKDTAVNGATIVLPDSGVRIYFTRRNTMMS